MPSEINAGFSASTPHLVAVSAAGGSNFPLSVDDTTTSDRALLELSDYTNNNPTTSSIMTPEHAQTSL
jgi:hypothetical protein